MSHFPSPLDAVRHFAPERPQYSAHAGYGPSNEKKGCRRRTKHVDPRGEVESSSGSRTVAIAITAAQPMACQNARSFNTGRSKTPIRYRCPDTVFLGSRALSAVHCNSPASNRSGLGNALMGALHIAAIARRVFWRGRGTAGAMLSRIDVSV